MILIAGGTGFVGRHLVKRMRAEGLAIRLIARDPDREMPGSEPGIEIVKGDIGDAASLERAAGGCHTIIHLVGIIQETTHATFESVHVEGTRRLLGAARAVGVRRFFFQSALGTRADAVSAYHRTKWAAEELVRGSGMEFTILRPSLIYGPGDQFTLRLSDMIRRLPVMPVIGSGSSKVQPIFVDDITRCIIRSATDAALIGRTIEIGGPDYFTYEEVTRAIARAMKVERPLVHMPLAMMRPAARLFEALLPKPPLTTDQLIMLAEDNICGLTSIRETFGFEPARFENGLKALFR